MTRSLFIEYYSISDAAPSEFKEVKSEEREIINMMCGVGLAEREIEEKRSKKTGWASDFTLKGHRHHICILVKPTRQRSVFLHLYQRNAIEH